MSVFPLPFSLVTGDLTLTRQHLSCPEKNQTFVVLKIHERPDIIFPSVSNTNPE